MQKSPLLNPSHFKMDHYLTSSDYDTPLLPFLFPSQTGFIHI